MFNFDSNAVTFQNQTLDSIANNQLTTIAENDTIISGTIPTKPLSLLSKFTNRQKSPFKFMQNKITHDDSLARGLTSSNTNTTLKKKQQSQAKFARSTEFGMKYLPVNLPPQTCFALQPTSNQLQVEFVKSSQFKWEFF